MRVLNDKETLEEAALLADIGVAAKAMLDERIKYNEGKNYSAECARGDKVVALLVRHEDEFGGLRHFIIEEHQALFEFDLEEQRVWPYALDHIPKL